MKEAKCEECGRLGAERAIAGRRFVLCDQCNDRLLVQIALDERIVEIVKLSTTDPARAIAILNEVYEAYRHIDHDAWLERNVRSQRALIFLQSGCHEDALVEFRTIERNLEAGSEEFAENKHSIANVLARDGKPRDAIHELELALADREHLRTGTVVGLLTAYARVASEHRWTVPSVYQAAFERAIHDWGMPVPPELVSSDLNQAILLAASHHLEAQDRYIALLEELREKSPESRTRLLDDFVRGEPVGYFRDQARMQLENGGDGPEEMDGGST